MSPGPGSQAVWDAGPLAAEILDRPRWLARLGAAHREVGRPVVHQRGGFRTGRTTSGSRRTTGFVCARILPRPSGVMQPYWVRTLPTSTATATRRNFCRSMLRVPRGWSVRRLEPGCYELNPVDEHLPYWRSLWFPYPDRDDPAKEATLWGDLSDPDGDGIPTCGEYGWWRFR